MLHLHGNPIDMDNRLFEVSLTPNMLRNVSLYGPKDTKLYRVLNTTEWFY